MPCDIQRTVNIPPPSIFMLAGSEGPVIGSARNDAQMCVKSSKRYFTSPENFAWLELSLVPEIESVFVDRDVTGKELRVIEVVDKRDADVRSKIYAREAEIMAAHPDLRFDFHIIARQGRQLSSIMQVAGKAGYRR